MNKHSLLRAALTGAAVIITLANAPAADRTWNGGAANGLWTNTANWGGTAPVANDVLVFDGSTRLTNTNNFAANTAFNGINFASGAGAFVLNQVANSNIVLNGNITNASANLQTFNGFIFTNTPGAMQIDTGAAGILFTNTGSRLYTAFTITKTGTGTLFLNADQSTAFSNNLIVSQGTLINVSTAAAPFGSEYTVMANGTAVGALSSGVLTATTEHSKTA